MAKLRLLLAAVMLGTLFLVPATASAARPGQAVSVPVTATAPGVASFVGSFDVTRFAVQNGDLVAIGTLTGTVTNLVTGATSTLSQALTLDVLALTATCDILHLELGPLDLNLLGLMVHLDRIVLDITAQSGPGNLLGNLLCGIAGLLDGNAPLSAIATLLNNLLRLLG
ncbi:MAG: ABC transporter substrate-binding protein [Chloroflexota bacterium]